jgi:hypothetical protein
LFLCTNSFDSRIQEIEKEIGGIWLVIRHLEARLELTGREEAQAEPDDLQPWRRELFNSSSSSLTSKEHGEDSKNRIVLSSYSQCRGDGLTQDLAVTEVDANKIDTIIGTP